MLTGTDMTKDYLLHRDTISRVFWEPYIITGYRKTNTSFWECVKYTCVMHNDVGNFWSHFIPLILWLIWLWRLSDSLDFSDPFWYPLVCIWIGGCSYALCSSIAHALACKSLETRQIACMIDYQGITMYGIGGCVAYYFYERPLDNVLYQYKWTLIVVCVIICCLATLQCSLSRFFWERQRYLMRIGSFVLPDIVFFMPFYLRLLTCICTGEQCIVETIPYHFMMFSFTLLSVFFFVSKLPEKNFPGKFDYFFHSHQMFHISSATVTSLQFYTVPYDANIHRSMLTMDPYYIPDVYTTFIPFLIVTIVGFSIVVILSVFVMKGILQSNKIDQTKSQ